MGSRRRSWLPGVRKILFGSIEGSSDSGSAVSNSGGSGVGGEGEAEWTRALPTRQIVGRSCFGGWTCRLWVEYSPNQVSLRTCFVVRARVDIRAAGPDID